MSETRRSKLLQIKEREDLKDSLVSKYAVKYGKSRVTVAREVDKFLQANSLTPENLGKLDEQVKEAQSEVISPVVGMSVESNESGRPKLHNRLTSSRSVSFMSAGSKISSSHRAGDDVLSVAGSSVVSSVLEVPQGKDEWATILNYKSIIFQEEEAKRKLRSLEQKQALRRELDRQVAEKQRQKLAERQAFLEFLRNEEHNKILADNREAYEAELRRQKALSEKQTRAQQILERRLKHMAETRQAKEQDKEYVRQLQLVQQREHDAFIKKKQQDAERMTAMLVENDEWRLKREQEEAERRLEEEELQQQYAKLAQKHEHDHIALLKEREMKQRQLMDLMTNTVLKEQAVASLGEDKELLQYYQARRQLEDLNDESVRTIEARRRKDIRAQLDLQIKEKHERDLLAKEQEIQQAQMWRHDSEAYFKEMADEKQRKLNLYTQHAKELKEQMELNGKSGGGLTTIERAYNKIALKAVIKTRSS